ncbi:MAG: extracellular solute-binding protein, partial [Clostridia bacterium]|nr:extracellular solute-binding protein [Clostridia bacterium]
MKRIISTLLLVAVMLTTVVASFTGCDLFGKKPGGGNAGADFVMPEEGFNTEETITIKFYHSMGAALQGILNDAIAEFNVLYPNIIIEHESLGDYDGVRNQIQTEITVGGQPNLAYCYPDHIAVYNEAGAVQTLDTLMSSDVVVTRADGTTETIGYTEAQLNDFIQAYLNEGRAFGDGKLYSLPISKSTEVLYYNIDALKAAGVVDADGNAAPPTTWEEMAIACEKLKATFGDSCIPLGYDSESNWFITMCEQYGSPYTSATGDN